MSFPQLGGKGANLCEMAKCGVNVPPGLTITTEVCQEFYRVGEYPQHSGNFHSCFPVMNDLYVYGQCVTDTLACLL
jgi:phosphoenolpyruvate synthase/pyruvate phosphate dikinase